MILTNSSGVNRPFSLNLDSLRTGVSFSAIESEVDLILLIISIFYHPKNHSTSNESKIFYTKQQPRGHNKWLRLTDYFLVFTTEVL